MMITSSIILFFFNDIRYISHIDISTQRAAPAPCTCTSTCRYTRVHVCVEHEQHVYARKESCSKHVHETKQNKPKQNKCKKRTKKMKKETEAKRETTQHSCSFTATDTHTYTHVTTAYTAEKGGE